MMEVSYISILDDISHDKKLMISTLSVVSLCFSHRSLMIIPITMIIIVIMIVIMVIVKIVIKIIMPVLMMMTIIYIYINII